MRTAMKEHADSGFPAVFSITGRIYLDLIPALLGGCPKYQPQMPLVVAALLLAALALYGETTADLQLAKFKRNPDNRGKSCRNGWWRYSRHPNYFFEWLHWFAYPLMGWGGDYQHWLWLAPVLMFCFLYFFTGIPFYRTTGLAQSRRGLSYVSTGNHLPIFPVVAWDLSVHNGSGFQRSIATDSQTNLSNAETNLI